MVSILYGGMNIHSVLVGFPSLPMCTISLILLSCLIIVPVPLIRLSLLAKKKTVLSTYTDSSKVKLVPFCFKVFAGIFRPPVLRRGVAEADWRFIVDPSFDLVRERAA